MSGIIGGAGSKSGVVGETELDYETGTWTATLHCGSGGTATLNSGYDRASYTKIGGLVTVTAWLYVNAISSPSGALSVRGLPFPNKVSGEDSEYSAVSFAYLQNWSALTSGHWIEGNIGSGGSTEFTVTSSNGTTREQIADHLQSNTMMCFSLTYIAD